METRFQTSFIPKKPLVTQESVHHSSSSTSIFMLIAVLLFVLSLGGAGLVFFGKGYFLKIQNDLKYDLAENEKRFNLPLIEELKRANTKIDLAKQLLNNHIAVSEAINIISALTAEKVYFTDFEFSATDASKNAVASQSGVYKVKMKGVADSFNSIAFQSDVFGRSQKYGTNKVLRNPILSDMALDAGGNVTFNFSADITLPDISYEKVLRGTIVEEQVVEDIPLDPLN